MIRYRKERNSILWEMKGQFLFETIEDLKAFVADQRTRDEKFVGETKRIFHACDVKLRECIDHVGGWENFCKVVVDGKTVGYCGE